jgi:hypothetical protein
MTAIVLLLALIPSAACIILSGYMAVHDIAGWGWFLFVGMLLGGFSYSTQDK